MEDPKLYEDFPRIKAKFAKYLPTFVPDFLTCKELIDREKVEQELIEIQ